jgi:hypothetical protein
VGNFTAAAFYPEAMTPDHPQPFASSGTGIKRVDPRSDFTVRLKTNA